MKAELNDPNFDNDNHEKAIKCQQLLLNYTSLNNYNMVHILHQHYFRCIKLEKPNIHKISEIAHNFTNFCQFDKNKI